MRYSRIKAVAVKEFIHIMRDPRSLGMAIFIPMLLLLLFGYALSLDVDRVPLAIWDQDQSPLSRDFISRFDGSPYFKINSYVSSYRDAELAIDKRDAMAAIIIPYDFSAKAGKSAKGSVQLILDGSDSNTATIASGYADMITSLWSEDLILKKIQKAGGRPVLNPVELRPRVWFNYDLESRNYIIPGLIAVIMMVISALLTSLTIAREWEQGTMEQLISTPVKGHELIFGKLLPYFIIGMTDVAIAVIMGEFLFHVPMRGSLVMLFFMSGVFLAGALSLGILISIIAKNQFLASQVAMIMTFLPSFLLSGFMSAISNMPKPLQIATHVIPARYFVTILKGIYLKGAGLRVLAAEASLLAVFGIIVMVVANKKFKKKLG
ncbi:ABC transporter permease [Desulforegula conservatrix]|uniref:ABC transporter permease n=1 Tax=Desulforegula conservatrix TaxID=153026 RepID=UPI0004041EB8|nr:ABC transporter permease [Desulforegula conservatrix]